MYALTRMTMTTNDRICAFAIGRGVMRDLTARGLMTPVTSARFVTAMRQRTTSARLATATIAHGAM